VTVLEIPTGARIPLGSPPQWLAAAAAAGWQCECTTTGPKAVCGTSHRKYEEQRCQHYAAGSCAMRLIVAPAADSALRLLCEDCARGHARAISRAAAASRPTTSGEPDDQLSLF
jgi:hypothetical protein